MKMGFITRSSGITSLNVMTGRNSPMPSRPYILRSGYPCNRLTCSVYMFHFLVFTVLPYITDCISQFYEVTHSFVPYSNHFRSQIGFLYPVHLRNGRHEKYVKKLFLSLISCQIKHMWISSLAILFLSLDNKLL